MISKPQLNLIEAPSHSTIVKVLEWTSDFRKKPDQGFLGRLSTRDVGLEELLQDREWKYVLIRLKNPGMLQPI